MERDSDIERDGNRGTEIYGQIETMRLEERERDRQTERQTEKERKKETNKQTEREREREREKWGRNRDVEGNSDGEREINRPIETIRQGKRIIESEIRERQWHRKRQ